ncbi:hypothetical protein Clacol_010223 [Clathrus columnatus]|uniref:Uncharacterized protein n=1 Tax=Clathrus columnatus TaxID=1419009 RepID=A0AAV5AMV3_9AGAM|nr:hypothetical protein Clacol_010223 [Clathrus columnatus]
MASETRQIIIESNDPNVTYVGEWTTVQTSSINMIDGTRLISVPTLQSTKTNSSFYFSFEGSSISVFGILNATNTEINPEPSSECIIDGISLGFKLGAFVTNNWALCAEDIPDGSHELTVKIISDGAATFYLEYLTYLPSFDVSWENSLIAINSIDPAIDYISGWTGSANPPGLNQTTDPNGLVNVTFVGVQLSWYMYTGAVESNAAVSSGEYSVDGKPFISFQIPTIETVGNPDLFPLLFITPSLVMSTHVLSVRYTGTKGQAPLVLHHLIIMNGSFSSTFPMMSGGDTNKTGTSHPTLASSGNHVGAIAGEVIGPIVGFVIFITIIFICLRYYRRWRGPLPLPDSSLDIMPFHMQECLSTLLVPETPKPRTHLVLSNVANPTEIAWVRPSDSDSVNMDPLHTSLPTGTSFTNDPPTRLMDLTVGIDLKNLQHRDNERCLSSPIMRRENTCPPSYTTDL